MSLQEKMRVVYKSMVDIVEAGGENSAPHLLFDDEEGNSCVLVMGYTDDFEKQKMVQMVRMLFAIKGVESYVLGSEAWMAVRSSREEAAQSPRPKDDPNRKEVISVLGVTRGGIEVLEGLIHREQDRVWVEEQDRKGAITQGMLTDLLPPEDMPPIPPHVKTFLEELLRRSSLVLPTMH